MAQDVNARQVDGQHYRSPIQHWDYVELNGLGYVEGCATKYIARNRKKYPNPRTDLNKALHYIEKLQDLHNKGYRLSWRQRFFKTFEAMVSDLFPGLTMEVQIPARQLVITPRQFAEANDLNETEERVIELLSTWTGPGDLQVAWEIVWSMISELGPDGKPVEGG